MHQLLTAGSLCRAGVGYIPLPSKRFDPDAISALLSPDSGYEDFGYVKFTSRPDAAQVIEDHVSPRQPLAQVSEIN
jgi:hypothetical protein